MGNQIKTTEIKISNRSKNGVYRISVTFENGVKKSHLFDEHCLLEGLDMILKEEDIKRCSCGVVLDKNFYALSRVDNKKICSDCGQAEALEGF